MCAASPAALCLAQLPHRFDLTSRATDGHRGHERRGITSSRSKQVPENIFSVGYSAYILSEEDDDRQSVMVATRRAVLTRDGY